VPGCKTFRTWLNRLFFFCIATPQRQNFVEDVQAQEAAAGDLGVSEGGRALNLTGKGLLIYLKHQEPKKGRLCS
jgi:hypothetical protein